MLTESPPKKTFGGLLLPSALRLGKLYGLFGLYGGL